MNNLLELQNNINYFFKDEKLLEQALTHLSYANDNNVPSYERLEFLGDAIIEQVVSVYIYKHFNFDVGALTKLRASLVSTDYLCNVSKKFNLESYVRKSKSLPQLSKKNIADLFESLVGAIYLDGGLEKVEEIIYKHIIISSNNLNYVLKNNIDYKSKLQEYMQANSFAFEYKLISSTGLDHEKTFKISLVVEGEEVTTKEGSSIHLAEEKCAEDYMRNVRNKK